VREEVYRVAARLRLNVFVVSNGSRPIQPPGASNVSMVLVSDSADAADDWIAERITATEVYVTSDIALASRCLKIGARVVSPIGKQWTQANIGNALAGREIARHLRELGANTRGPAPLTQRDRSRFLGRDAALAIPDFGPGAVGRVARAQMPRAQSRPGNRGFESCSFRRQQYDARLTEITIRWSTEPKLKTTSKGRSNTRLSSRRYCGCWKIHKFSKNSSPTTPSARSRFKRKSPSGRPI